MDFGLVLHRPIETTELIGTWLILGAMNTRGGARFANQVLGFEERKFANQVLWLYGAAHIHCPGCEQKAWMAAA